MEAMWKLLLLFSWAEFCFWFRAVRLQITRRAFLFRRDFCSTQCICHTLVRQCCATTSTPTETVFTAVYWFMAYSVVWKCCGDAVHSNRHYACFCRLSAVCTSTRVRSLHRLHLVVVLYVFVKILIAFRPSELKQQKEFGFTLPGARLSDEEQTHPSCISWGSIMWIVIHTAEGRQLWRSQMKGGDEFTPSWCSPTFLTSPSLFMHVEFNSCFHLIRWCWLKDCIFRS